MRPRMCRSHENGPREKRAKIINKDYKETVSDENGLSRSLRPEVMFAMESETAERRGALPVFIHEFSPYR